MCVFIFLRITPSTLFSISTFKLITFFSDVKYFTVRDSLEVEKEGNSNEAEAGSTEAF